MRAFCGVSFWALLFAYVPKIGYHVYMGLDPQRCYSNTVKLSGTHNNLILNAHLLHPFLYQDILELVLRMSRITMRDWLLRTGIRKRLKNKTCY